MPFTVLFRDGIASIAKHIKSFCGAQHRGTKPPPGGINGFNAVKARWDGIERIQEVSESPAQLDFAALQSFSTHAAPTTADAPTLTPKTQNPNNPIKPNYRNNLAELIITNTDPQLCTNAPTTGFSTPVIAKIMAIKFRPMEKLIFTLMVVIIR